MILIKKLAQIPISRALWAWTASVVLGSIAMFLPEESLSYRLINYFIAFLFADAAVDMLEGYRSRSLEHRVINLFLVAMMVCLCIAQIGEMMGMNEGASMGVIMVAMLFSSAMALLILYDRRKRRKGRMKLKTELLSSLRTIIWHLAKGGDDADYAEAMIEKNKLNRPDLYEFLCNELDISIMGDGKEWWRAEFEVDKMWNRPDDSKHFGVFIGEGKTPYHAIADIFKQKNAVGLIQFDASE